MKSMREYSPTKMIMEEIMTKTSKGLMSCHHALQRSESQWSTIDKSNYIADILHGYPMHPLILAEESCYGGRIIWILDGVQRVSNIIDFINNKITISKNVERYLVEYVVPVLDEDGVQKRDENDKPISRVESFDIRGKKFKQLPKEMQDDIKFYGFDVVLYQDCTEEDIAYHLKRYNAGKPMNTEQKGFTFIGERFASTIRNIVSMPFFEDGVGKYTATDFKNGRIYRVIAESIMTTRYLDNYSKNYAVNCEFIKKNATTDDFEYLKGIIKRLENTLCEEVGAMFNSKNSFLWFGLYSKFLSLGLDDNKFDEFMFKLNKGMYTRDEDGKIIKDAPMTGICTREIDGTTFEEILSISGTKDVNVVKTKIDFLIKLMCDYFGIDASQINKDNDFADFADNFASEEAAVETLLMTSDSDYKDFMPSTINAAASMYKSKAKKSELDDCLSYKSYIDEVGVDENDIDIPIYVYGVKYIFDNDIDIDIAEWLTEFSKNAFGELNNRGENLKTERIVAEKKQMVCDSISRYAEKSKLSDNLSVAI